MCDQLRAGQSHGVAHRDGAFAVMGAVVPSHLARQPLAKLAGPEHIERFLRRQGGLDPGQELADMLGSVPCRVVPSAATSTRAHLRVVTDVISRTLVGRDTRADPLLDRTVTPSEDPRPMRVDPDQSKPLRVAGSVHGQCSAASASALVWWMVPGACSGGA